MSDLIRGRFGIIASLLACMAYDLVALVHDAFVVHVLSSHEKVISDARGDNLSEAGAQRIAIVAVRPNVHSEPFTLNLLRALRETGYYTLIVSNAVLSERQRDLFRSWSNRIIERAPVGRDFGCYQTGLKALGLLGSEVPSQCERLVLANDSMFYRADSGKIIADMERLDNAWSAMFENYEHAYHAQSFFLMFGPEVFGSSAFKRFWLRYKPYSSRTHSIKKGEIGLSRALKRASFTPTAYFNSVRIQRVVEEVWNDPLEVCRVLPDISKISASVWSERIQSLVDRGLAINRPQTAMAYLWEDFSRKTAWTAESTNPTHMLGLFLNRFANAPLKRDLCYRNTCTIAQVARYACGFDDRELAALQSDLRSRGLAISLGPIKRLLFIRGRI